MSASPIAFLCGLIVKPDFLMYTRGSQDDWDRYAAVSGDHGWSWKKMMKYFKKTERFQSPVDNHNTTGEFDPSVHGFDGMLSVSLPGYRTSIGKRGIDAAHQLGGVQSFVLDYNSGNGLGIGKCCVYWSTMAMMLTFPRVVAGND